MDKTQYKRRLHFLSVCFFIVTLFSCKNKEPIFEPFYLNQNVTFHSLWSNGYDYRTEDVIILGKQVGDTLVYYQLEERNKSLDVIARWYNVAMIDFDSLRLNAFIESKNGQIISNFIPKKYYSNEGVQAYDFFVKNNLTKEIFECSIVPNHYDTLNDYLFTVTSGFPINQ